MAPVIVCFEGKVRSEQEAVGEEYYKHMSELVASQPGFISQTPFISTEQAGSQVLYVVFDTEEHLQAWKQEHRHLKVQADSKRDVLIDYRIRAGEEVLEDASKEHKAEEGQNSKWLLLWTLPQSSKQNVENGVDLSTAASSLTARVWLSLVDAATYVNETHMLWVTSWSSIDSALIVKEALERLVEDGEVRLMRVKRDYGKFQRMP